MNINKTFIAFLVPIELFTLALIIIPFVQYNNLNVWDMPGHYSMVWYIRDYLLPHPLGWNPFFYGGFPQGQFYPFMFHYLAALLGLLVGSVMGLKVILSLSILITPASFYYFARKINFTSFESGLIMLLMWILMFIPYQHLGGNFYSTFLTGLVTGMFTLPFFFFYLGKLSESLDTGRYVFPSILLAFIILCHVFTATVAVIALVSFFLAKPGNLKKLFFVAKHISLSLLLTAFWVIPLLCKFSYVSITKISSFNINLLGLQTFFVVFITLFFMLAKNRGDIKPVLYLILTLTLISCFGYYLPINFHYGRLIVFVLLLMPVCVIQIFRVKASPIRLMIATPILTVMTLLVLLGLISISLNLSYPRGLGDMSINPGGVDDIDIDFGKVYGRILAVSSPDTVPHIHAVYNLVPINTKNCVLRGVFRESSLHERYVSRIHLNFDPYTFVWRDYNETINKNRAEIVPYQLNVFNINYIFTSKKLNWSNGVLDSEQIEVLEYTSKVTGEEKLIDLLIPKPWEVDGGVLKLLDSTENTSRIIVWYMNSSTKKETLKVLKRSEDLDYIKFEIKANETASVLLSSDFKYWRAYVDGVEVKIYVHPSYLMFYGGGIIELKYEESMLSTLNATTYKSMDVGYKNQTFALYTIGNSQLIEVLNYTPGRIDRGWSESVWGWFNSENVSKVMVYSETPLPDFIGVGNETVEIIERSETWEYIKFMVNSKKPVPVLIKISEFPNWRAYVGGREARIYRASPHMMLIYACGMVELRYGPVLWDYLGMLMSLLALGWLCFLVSKGIKKKKRFAG
ncbi:MAG: hypothetical protein KAU03_00170 [Candidatus Altiarchaeales archaeon]|nr:hypothetical protein [Candidatus Altiarchaeales archaeon]